MMSEFLSDTQKQTIREILHRVDVRQPLTTSLADIIALGRLFYGFLELEAMVNDMSQDDVGIAYRAGYTTAMKKLVSWIDTHTESIVNSTSEISEPKLVASETVKAMKAVIGLLVEGEE